MRRLLGNAPLSFASQAFNTASNLVLGIAVAHAVDPAHLGAWAIGYTIYGLALQVMRAATTTPVLIDHSIGDVIPPDTAVGALSAAGIVGVVGALPLGVAALALPGDAAEACVVFALLLPVLMIQDALRYLWFRERRAWRSALADAGWFAAQSLGYLLLVGTGHLSAASITAVWASTSAITVAVGLRERRALLRLGAARSFAERHRAQIPRLVGESLAGTGALQALPVLLAVVAEYRVAGGIRASQTLFGAATFAVLGMTPLLTTSAVHRIRARASLTPIVLGGVAGVAALSLLTFAVVTAFPAVGQAMTGRSWGLVATILIPSTLTAVLRGPWFVVPVVMRARHQLTELVRLRMHTAVVALLVPSLGAAWRGLDGAAWGMALAAVVNAAQGLLALHRTSEH